MDRLFVSLVSALVCLLHIVAQAGTLDEQRAAFREVYPGAERGDWKAAADKESLLKTYILWPDLRAAWLRAHLDAADRGEIDEFLKQYEALKPARELRYHFALQLATNERFGEYLEIYRRSYQELGISKLDCLAAHAEIVSSGGRGVDDSVLERARALWLVGRSQVAECDPVFEYLRGAGLLDAELYRQRFELAITDRQFSLARYLARSLDASYLDEANSWIAARDTASAFLESDALQSANKTRREQLAYAIERLSLKDAKLASGYWEAVRARHVFSPQQVNALSRHIALWAARQHLPEASEMLRTLSPDAVDIEVRRWMVRSALIPHDWPAVVAAIDQMPEDEQQLEEWRYWLAVALNKSGEDARSLTLFKELAAERSYYGFLAADELDLSYVWSHAAMHQDEEVLRTLAENPSVIRARELYYVGLESRGRSEWDAAISSLLPEEKIQAAILAHGWNWHSRAIATAASVDQYDDLELRYPLPYREHFEQHSATAQIPHSWAYGVARSESLFMSDVRSIAGAIGVMQLMPETGRRTAVALKLPFTGVDSLTDPVTNIQLGIVYLGQMSQRFSDNRVLATAAYNAGPLRVERWIPDDSLDARIWIENIPYNETRSYVRRVLATDTIFHWRLTGLTKRLSEGLTAIGRQLPEQMVDTARNEPEDS
jgi:soluble lytic murein transglycosylase